MAELKTRATRASVGAFLAAGLLLIGLSGCMSLHDKPAAFEPWYPSTNENGDALFAVFEGRIPCTDPDRVGCGAVKVALVVYRNATSAVPTSYKLARVYVAESPEGQRMVVDGRLHMVRGTNLDPDAAVYRLDSHAPPGFQLYWLIGPDILFMLDADLNPRVGTAGWSYVLNRTR